MFGSECCGLPGETSALKRVRPSPRPEAARTTKGGSIGGSGGSFAFRAPSSDFVCLSIFFTILRSAVWLSSTNETSCLPSSASASQTVTCLDSRIHPIRARSAAVCAFAFSISMSSAVQKRDTAFATCSFRALSTSWILSFRRM